MKSSSTKTASHTSHVSKAANQSNGSSQPTTAPPATSPAVVASQPAASPASVGIAPAPGSSLASRVAYAVSLLGEVTTVLALDSEPSLSKDDIKRAVKFRKGGETVVPDLASLSASFGLEVPTRPTAEMTANLESASALMPLRVSLAQLTKQVDDVYNSDRSAVWTTATMLYSMMKRIARNEPKLAASLAPLQQFFSYRHSSVAAAHPKRALEKPVTKAQQKAQARAEKLKAQLAKLQAVLPGATPAAPPTASGASAAPAPAAAPAAPHAS